MRFIFLIITLVLFNCVHGQTLGGNAAYSFLKLPATPILTAAGGVNVSYRTNDVGLAANNPALYRADLHHHLNLSFNGLPGAIKAFTLTGSHFYEKKSTSLGGQVYFIDYGTIPQTDASGNRNGDFHPVDFVIQFSAARQYLEKWNYGATLKYIHSAYGQFRSSAVAMDAGIHYEDSSKLFFAGLVAKNMGFQIKTYAGEREDMPFELQAGITKKLAKAPFGFSFTAQQLHRFNILYNDTIFNNENDTRINSGFFNKLFNHFVVASHVYIGNHLEATLGYNHLRRSELNAGTTGNGLNGFSMGIRAKFLKLQVLYARTHYQRNVSYNQLGITLHMNRFFGAGSL
ncbi:MAG: type IX secretion system protein PorQ [Flavisolibacter sp.]